MKFHGGAVSSCTCEPSIMRSTLATVPLLFGAGTKGKLVQALMAGTPTVSTTIGIEGLHLRHHEHVLVADDPHEFAEARRSDRHSAFCAQQLKDLRPLGQGGDGNHLLRHRLMEHPLERLDFIGKYRSRRLAAILESRLQPFDEVLRITPA